jgi:hypothetical protein
MKMDILFLHDILLMDDRHMVKYNQVNEVDYIVQVQMVSDGVVQDCYAEALFEVFYDGVYVHFQEEEKILFLIWELWVLEKR